MEAFIWYLIGVLALGVSNYIYMICISRKETLIESKKLIAYRSFKVGLTSWIGIIIILAVYTVGAIFAFDEWVEDKLN